MALGTYVAVQLAAWVPHAELLLEARTLALVPETPFPNVLGALSSAFAVRMLLVAAAGAGLLFAAGIRRRALGLVLWYAWACLMERLYFLPIPSDGYVGWLLLASCLIPAGESWRRDAAAGRFEVPREIVLGAWLVLAVSYTASGIDKLASPSWTAGDAVAIVLRGPIAGAWGAWLVEHVPPGWFQLATWGALALECGYIGLCLWPAGRRFAWTGAVAMHAGVLALLQIESVAIAMLIFHGFVFDPRWLPQALRVRAASRPIRGEPVLQPAPRAA
jgi:hypothetical protein